MIPPSTHVKHYASAKKRFLEASIVRFFEREFPKLFGPTMARKIAQELVTLVDRQLPAKDHLRPGQCVWNAVSRTTRPDHPRHRIVPVILTLVNDTDIHLYETGANIRVIRERALPCSVRGPVLLAALRRLAAICFSEAILIPHGSKGWLALFILIWG